MTKKVTSGAGLLYFSGADQARFIVPVELGVAGAKMVARLAGRRFARIELLYFNGFLPGLRFGGVWVAFLLAVSVGELRFWSFF